MSTAPNDESRSAQRDEEGAPPESRLPLVVLPHGSEATLRERAPRLRDCADRYLPRLGSILFRGFGVRDPAAFQEFVAVFARPDRVYDFQRTPGADLASASDLASRLTQHWRGRLHHAGPTRAGRPSRLWLCCTEPGRLGAHLAIADGREVHRRVPARIRRTWSERGLTYLRNYGGEAGSSWTERFGTSEGTEVEQRCRAWDIEWEWQNAGKLRLRKPCSPVLAHPDTGALVWFNEAHIRHASALTELQAGQTFKAAQDLPCGICHADGSAIDTAEVQAVAAAFAAARLVVTWEAGDVLLLDNLLTAHADESLAAHGLHMASELSSSGSLELDPMAL